MTAAPTIVVAGALANKPGNGGEAWVRTSWVRGLQQLGFETWFVEELHGVGDRAAAVRWWRDEVAAAGLAPWSVLIVDDCLLGPLDPDGLTALFDRTDLVVNISGNLRRRELTARARRRAFVDLDPGYTQSWWEAGTGVDDRAAHDLFFSVGERIGAADCPIPTAGVRWLPCRQPVVLDDWEAAPAPADAPFTTVCTWRAPFGAPSIGGVEFESKHHAMRRLGPLPERTSASFGIATSMHPADHGDRERLVALGWDVRDADVVAPTSGAFRDYVHASRGECSAVQGIYAARSGWFSDRSARYLAAGRPVVVGDTGFGDVVPLDGWGLIPFADVDGAVRAVRAVLDEPMAHAEAAHQLAVEHFAADRVLGRFVDMCGLP